MSKVEKLFHTNDRKDLILSLFQRCTLPYQEPDPIRSWLPRNCNMHYERNWKNRTPLKSIIHSFIQKRGPWESTLSILTTTCLVLGPLDPLSLSLTKIFSLSFFPFSSSLSIEEQSGHAKLNSLKRSKHQRKTTSKFPAQIFLLNPHGCKLFFDLWKTNK